MWVFQFKGKTQIIISKRIDSKSQFSNDII